MFTAFLLFLKGVPVWVWEALGVLAMLAGIFFAGEHRQSKLDQVKYDKLKAEYTGFVADVKAKGEVAQKIADKQKAAGIAAKERTDAENKTSIVALAADNERLRRAYPRGSTVPPAPAASKRSDLACFDRTELGAATDGLLAELQGQAGEGAAATVDLNAAKNWAKKLDYKLAMQ